MSSSDGNGQVFHHTHRDHPIFSGLSKMRLGCLRIGVSLAMCISAVSVPVRAEDGNPGEEPTRHVTLRGVTYSIPGTFPRRIYGDGFSIYLRAETLAPAPQRYNLHQEVFENIRVSVGIPGRNSGVSSVILPVSLWSSRYQNMWSIQTPHDIRIPEDLIVFLGESNRPNDIDKNMLLPIFIPETADGSEAPMAIFCVSDLSSQVAFPSARSCQMQTTMNDLEVQIRFDISHIRHWRRIHRGVLDVITAFSR